jgi:hypothetical protein
MSIQQGGEHTGHVVLVGNPQPLPIRHPPLCDLQEAEKEVNHISIKREFQVAFIERGKTVVKQE